MGRANQFSYDALGLLFDYFDEVDPDMELDVIAVCCDYAEDTLTAISGDYDFEGSLAGIVEQLEEVTTVVGTTPAGLVVYVKF
jgi:hypothetical protein